MTTIAWDGKTLAADKAATFQSEIWIVTKIRRFADGRMAGCAGPATYARRMMAWLETKEGLVPKAQKKESTSVYVLEILSDGTPMWHGTNGEIEQDKGIAAIGSGAHYALAAMACGRTAAQAVAIAARFDPYTGGGIDVLKLKGR